MHAPYQPAFGDFVPRFLGALFGEEDRVVVCQLRPGGSWSNDSLTRPDASAWLLDRACEPNLYFRASSHDGTGAFGSGTCLSARALFVDIDYGEAGHRQASPFATFEDALAYLLTAPVRPSLAWQTGHGIQAAFLLREPFVFRAGTETAERIDRYKAVGQRLAEMLRADAAFTPEHAYRVPGTLNRKADTPEVRGKLLWWEFNRRYDFAELQARCGGYGIDDLLLREQAQADAAAMDGSDSLDSSDSLNVPYEELPQDLRDEIEGGGERSERLFGIVGRMARDGYTDACIQSAVAKGWDFAQKYGRRQGGLAGEVGRCLDKIRQGRSVYPSCQAPPFQVCNLPDTVPLAECAKLAPALDEMLGRYERAAGIDLAPRVRDAARFHEHAVQSYPSGVLESPCGAGKSVWALCRTALHASDTDRHLYVVETVETLYRAAGMLERLTETPVGRVHGFRPDKCRELCGQEHTWSDCSFANQRCVCHACHANGRCAYFTRAEQLGRPILCMTHNGLIRMLEEDAAVLKNATVIVDEELSPFNSLRVSFADLERVARRFGREELNAIFPCTSFAQTEAMEAWRTGNAKSFAARHFVYCGEQETAALRDACSGLRSKSRTWPRRSAETGEIGSAEDVLAQILNFFRPSARGDAAYAYREGADDQQGTYVQAVRSRFDFGTQHSYRRLWILNASAQLSPHPYPDNLPVFACPDLPGNSSLVTLRVVRGNPTKTRQAGSVRLSEVPLRLDVCRRHEKVLLVLDKKSDEAGNVRALLRKVWDGQHLPGDRGKGPAVVELRRGRIKGVNNAGDCTLALLTAMATFTGIDDCALHAALHYRRTFPDTPHVYTATGSPNWPGGRMKLPAMRTYFALRSLDELYQTIWRTAVRNDRPVEAVVALPDEHWLAALYRTVMPGMCVESTWVETKGGQQAGNEGTEDEGSTEASSGGWDFEQDERMYATGGVLRRLVALRPGKVVKKKDLPRLFGYHGKNAWEKNKGTIMSLAGGLLEPGRTNRTLRRKAKS